MILFCFFLVTLVQRTGYCKPVANYIPASSNAACSAIMLQNNSLLSYSINTGWTPPSLCMTYDHNCCTNAIRVSTLVAPNNDFVTVKSYWCSPFYCTRSPMAQPPQTSYLCDQSCVQPVCTSFTSDNNICYHYNYDCCNDVSRSWRSGFTSLQLNKVVECPNIFDSSTGTVSGGPYLAYLPATFSCKPNYFIPTANSASLVYNCLITSTWDKLFTPCTATCGTIGTLANGVIKSNTNVLSNGRFVVTTVVTFTCNPNYFMIGSARSACIALDSWSPTILPTCKLSTCADWVGLTDGIVKYSQPSQVQPNRWLINTRADFSCNLGYQLIGATSSICISNDIWSPATKPYCKLMTCADWNGLGNGTVRYSPNSPVANRWPFNTHANFACNLGYQLIGSTSSVCISNDIWSPATKPYCKLMTCADWNGLGNGTVRYIPNSPVEVNRWAFNTHADFTCNLGYELIGTPSSICIGNDNWSPTTKPYCQRRTCNDTFFNDVTTGTPESTPPFYSLTQYNYNCKTNFVCGWNNFSVYHCDANGHWKEPKLLLCQGTCAPLPHIANITLIYSSSYNDNNSLERPVVGSKLNLTCQKGFMMRLPTRTPVNFETKEGPLAQECLSTQLWKRAPPYCVELNDNNTVPIELPCDPQMYTDCPPFITPDTLKEFKKTLEKIKPFPEFNFDSDMPPGSAMRKFVRVTYSMGCMAVMIVLSIAVGIAVLRQNFDNSLEFVNFCTTVVLLLSYIVFMAVIDRQGPLVHVLNEGGCMIFAYCLEFLFLCCFLLKIFKAIELLGIFGNILSNENMIRPFYIAFVVFWSSFFFTLFTFMGIGTDISNDSTCLLNLNSRIITVVLMSFCAFASWLAFIVVEASGCSPFEVLRIGRQEERSKLSFLDYLRVMTYAEVPVTFFAWLTNIYAQFTQQFAWYPIAFGLNIVAGILALQCQFGAGIAVKSALLRLKKRLKAKRMKMSCKEIMKHLWHRKKLPA